MVVTAVEDTAQEDCFVPSVRLVSSPGQYTLSLMAKGGGGMGGGTLTVGSTVAATSMAQVFTKLRTTRHRTVDRVVAVV